MGVDELRELLEKIPVTLLLAAFLGWVGYGYYQFTVDPGSPLLVKQHQITDTQAEIGKLRSKIKQMNDFARTLDVKRLELRGLAQQLDGMKATLSETIDMPDLMKMLLIEAKRAGLTVTSLKPLKYKNSDFYGEQAFEFTSTGIYFQYVEFLNNVANLQKIIRVDMFKFKPNTPSTAKYVVLTSDIQFEAYRYIGTQADEVSRRAGSSPGSRPASGGM